MADRYYIDCSEFPDSKCSLRLSGTKQEVVDAAYEHGVKQHGHEPNQEFRRQLEGLVKEDKLLAQV